MNLLLSQMWEVRVGFLPFKDSRVHHSFLHFKSPQGLEYIAEWDPKMSRNAKPVLKQVHTRIQSTPVLTCHIIKIRALFRSLVLSREWKYNIFNCNCRDFCCITIAYLCANTTVKSYSIRNLFDVLSKAIDSNLGNNMLVSFGTACLVTPFVGIAQGLLGFGVANSSRNRLCNIFMSTLDEEKSKIEESRVARKRLPQIKKIRRTAVF